MSEIQYFAVSYINHALLCILGPDPGKCYMQLELELRSKEYERTLRTPYSYLL